MIEFDEAISSARSNVQKLVADAKNIRLEEVLISEDEKLYEVTLSYDVSSPKDSLPAGRNSSLFALATIMGQRREHKVFLVDSQSGKFRGFRNKEV